MEDKEKKKDIYLGLDISTECIGVCILIDDGTEEGKVVELTHIMPKTPNKMKPIEKLFIKKKAFEEFLMKYKDLGINQVVIEEPLLRSNNVNTVSTLLRFNGMVSDCVYNVLGIVPEYISSYEAREYAFPELMSVRKYGKDEKQYDYVKIMSDIKKSKFVLFGSYPWSIDKKIVIHNKVSERFPDIEWLYDVKGELKKENFDACDAYVAVIGHLNMKRYGKLKFKSNILMESNDGKGTREIRYNIYFWDRTLEKKTYVVKKDVKKLLEKYEE